jgi:hypothetical protein
MEKLTPIHRVAPSPLVDVRDRDRRREGGGRGSTSPGAHGRGQGDEGDGVLLEVRAPQLDEELPEGGPELPPEALVEAAGGALAGDPGRALSAQGAALDRGHAVELL